MFIRFIIDEMDNDSQVPTGIFHAAGYLRDSGLLADHEARRLQALRNWFDKYLEKPSKFSRSSSKAQHKKHKAISWFRDSATKHIKNIREMMQILSQHGIVVRMITTERPGYVVYEDEFQVVAEPFSDTDVE